MIKFIDTVGSYSFLVEFGCWITERLHISVEKCRWEDAESAFKAAVKAAKVYGDKQIETFSKVQIGIVRGNAAFTKRKASFEEYNPDISMFMPTETV